MNIATGTGINHLNQPLHAFCTAAIHLIKMLDFQSKITIRETYMLFALYNCKVSSNLCIVKMVLKLEGQSRHLFFCRRLPCSIEHGLLPLFNLSQP